MITVVSAISTKWYLYCLDKVDQPIDLYKAKSSFKNLQYLAFTHIVQLSWYHNYFAIGYIVPIQCGTESEGLSTWQDKLAVSSNREIFRVISN